LTFFLLKHILRYAYYNKQAYYMLIALKNGRSNQLYNSVLRPFFKT